MFSNNNKKFSLFVPAGGDKAISFNPVLFVGKLMLLKQK